MTEADLLKLISEIHDSGVKTLAMMRAMGIAHTANTPVGDAMLRGVSGGTRVALRRTAQLGALPHGGGAAGESVAPSDLGRRGTVTLRATAAPVLATISKYPSAEMMTVGRGGIGGVSAATRCSEVVPYRHGFMFEADCPFRFRLQVSANA